MSHQPTRRDVLKTSAFAALGAGVLTTASAAKRPSPNDRIRFAMIGVGGRGGAHLKPAFEHGDIVALCDIDAETRSKAMLNYPDAATFSDFRRMFDSMAKDIDAVVVATPDHTHAPAAAMALHLGKHVYCEKPLTRSIWEARELAGLARTARTMTQMGNQGTAGDDLRKVAALLKAGKLGAVKEIHCWTNRAGGWWPQGVDRPAGGTPIPHTIDWDLWLGPSPRRDYAPGYHPFAWRGWWDFGSGALGDIGCHCMNLPFMAFDLRDPIAVTAETSGHNRDSFPSWSIIKYEFDARGSRPAVNLHWYDGGKMPPKDLAPNEKLEANGCLIVCEKGTLHMPHEYGAGGHLISGEPLPEVDFVKSPGHFAEWAEAIKGGPIPRGNLPGYACALTEVVLLGNLAVWADGPRVTWDARNMRAGGAENLEKVIHPEYRRGWKL